MSHLKERTEKKCLNCGADIHGRYCHKCGQENVEPKESFWHLTNHFFEDITHFDGKFFSTLKRLLLKPGFLAQEYLIGRRASYLHPVRMYVFTSAFFFLIFFGFYQKEEDFFKVNGEPFNVENLRNELQVSRGRKSDKLKQTTSDSVKQILAQQITDIDSDLIKLQKDSTNLSALKTVNKGITLFQDNDGGKSTTLTQYDSIQHSLPSSKRDGFFTYRIKKQIFHLKEKYKTDVEVWRALSEKFRHLVPQMLFIGLPLFGLVLLLLYVRRKEFFYVNHIIFLIYLFCATFILTLASLWFASLAQWVHLGSDIISWCKFIFFLLIIFYWYKSMRIFYKQSRGKTILKFSLFLFLNFFIMIFVFLFFFAFSAMTI